MEKWITFETQPGYGLFFQHGFEGIMIRAAHESFRNHIDNN